MQLKLNMIDWKMVLEAVKWGVLIGGVLAVVHFIKDSGRKEVQLETTQKTVKVLEQKNEVKNDVQRTINRVVSDTKYRNRVRELYDTRPAD